MPLDGSEADGRSAETGDWTVLLDQPVPALSGVLPALAARDSAGRRGFALACRADLPPRRQAIASLSGVVVDSLLMPQALIGGRLPGASRDSLLAVLPLPPGPPVLTPTTRCRPWTESELIHDLLRPAARALAVLADRGLTHRAVRVENIFRAREGGPVMLGDAFCLPPAYGQPAWCEAPQVAQCVPEGRGNGVPADDIFALGVAAICVAVGRVPWQGLDPRALHRGRLERGSFTALSADLRLPGAIIDLLRAMLADEPELRPDAATVAGWPGGMGGRKGTARPVRRASRPLVVAGEQALDTRTAAWLLAGNSSEGVRAIRSGAVDGFLRRGIGDPAMAEKLADLTRAAASDPAEVADDLLLCRAIVMLDPLAPLCWRGVAMMPDGLGPLLARAAVDAGTARLSSVDLAALVNAEAPARWAIAGGDVSLSANLSRLGAQWRLLLRTTPPIGGIDRLMYQLNPGLPCLSPMLGGAWAGNVGSLLDTLERGAPAPDSSASQGLPPPDPHIAAWLAARNEAGVERVLSRLSGPAATSLVARLGALARIQQRFVPGRRMPRLAGWVAACASATLATWQSRSRRAEVTQRLAEVAPQGDLSALLAVLDDPGARRADEEGAAAAHAEIAAIDAELAVIGDGARVQREVARATGSQAAAGVALAVLLGAAMWVLAR